MRLTKEEFCEALDKYKNMLQEESEIIEALDINFEWKPDSWVTEYYNMIVTLCDFEDDDYDLNYGSVLDYFIWETHFGENFKPGSFKVGGKAIELTSAEVVYDVIKYMYGDKEYA